MTDDYTYHAAAERDNQLHMSGSQTAMWAAVEQQERKLENGHFLNELRDADLDSDLVDWIEDEVPTWFSGARAVSNRPESWDQEATLMMQSKRERVFAESNPGRLLRDRPYLLAIAQGQDRVDDRRRPMSSDERRLLYGAAEVAADLMTLSKNAKGVESVTTATTESRVKREDEEESTTEKAARFYK